MASDTLVFLAAGADPSAKDLHFWFRALFGLGLVAFVFIFGVKIHLLVQKLKQRSTATSELLAMQKGSSRDIAVAGALSLISESVFPVDQSSQELAALRVKHMRKQELYAYRKAKLTVYCAVLSLVCESTRMPVPSSSDPLFSHLAWQVSR